MKYKTTYESTSEQYVSKRLRSFYTFIYDRQLVYHNRFIKKLPRDQWTSNEIFKTTKYTNVYRELDRGTIWCFNNILHPFTDSLEFQVLKPDIRHAWKKMLWELCMYRLLNKVETFEIMGFTSWRGYASTDVRDIYFEKLQGLINDGVKVWTAAHITLQSNLKATRQQNFRMILDKLWGNIPKLASSARKLDNIEEMYDELVKMYGFGPFISYEVATDLAYLSETKFDVNQWANPGPGCTPGIQLLFPQVKGKIELIDRMRFLRQNQAGAFKVLDLPFLDIAYKHKYLSLRNIEHSLCEWRKYYNQSHKIGRPRPKFNPVSVV